MSDLLLNISHCDEVKKAIINSNHPCYSIVSSQNNDLASFQLPEPWNGDIENAIILFLSSNPSFDPNEEYPKATWSDDKIYQFHNDRFSDSYYIKNKTKVTFWNAMRKCTSWILNIPLDDPELETHICSTEVVHCKSKKQYGFKEACSMCEEKWLKKTIQEFKGEYLVVMGKPAEERFRKYRLKNRNTIDKKIKVLFVPHPSRWCYIGTDQYIRETFFTKQLEKLL